ncbi:MAG TPA: YceI family protein [Candidatus Binatia bacterium]|nr:YceI family protein [Candidatus Binatia bacterium]
MTRHRPRRRLALALLLVLPALARGSDWTIDPAHTSAGFAVRHMMVSTVRGTFGTVRGRVTLDPNDLTKSSVDASIDAATIDTRNEKRDAHLRSADFLDVERYPTIGFRSTRVTPAAGGHWRVEGDLTLHGVTRPVVLDVEGSPTPTVDALGKPRLGGSASTKISRKDFGVVWNKALETGGVAVGDEVAITIDVELVPAGD